MSRIDIVFCEVLDPDSRGYVEQRIRAMHAAAELLSGDAGKHPTVKALAGDVAGVMAGLKRRAAEGLPLAPAPTLSKFDRGEQRLVRTRKACFLADVARRFPMLDGEHVTPGGDLVSYLSRDWLPYRKGMVVLRRITNRSVTCYVMPDAQVQPRRRRVLLSPAPPRGRGLLAAAGYEPQYGNAARELAQGLAGLGEPPLNLIGVFLITAFWPTSADAATDWNAVYRNLQLILKNGLAQEKVNTAASKVKGFVTFLTNEYQALRSDPKTRREDLMRALAPYDVAFFLDIVNVFMFEDKPTADVAAASLANFMLGANLHIGLNQERALVDPNHVRDPENSAYAQTAANLARTYADYARKAAPQVEARRLAQISGVKERDHTSCPSGGMGMCVSIYRYWFEDANNGYRSKDYSYSTSEKHPAPAKEQATEARRAYVAKVKTGLQLKSQVYDVAGYWDQVAKNPIALRYGPPTAAPGLDPKGWRGRVPVEGSTGWVDGYRVRYAVSFLDGASETPRGPWWAPASADGEGYCAGSPNALPRLTEVPVDPFFRASGRRIYRQFKGGPVEVVGALDNNTDRTFPDTKARAPDDPRAPTDHPATPTSPRTPPMPRAPRYGTLPVRRWSALPGPGPHRRESSP